MAIQNPRQYSNLTIKRLYSLSGNKCAFPGCRVTFLNPTDETNISQVCHIQDANENLYKSDRFNSTMTDKDRADYNNLILLCPNHHVETNDTTKYTVEVLKKMKHDHERNIFKLTSGTNIISKYPSILSKIVNNLGSELINNLNTDDKIPAPDTEEKILFNNINYYKPIIQEYSVYQGKLNSIYGEIEKQGSSKKDFLLQNIRNLYLKEKGNFRTIEEIRKNADSIFRNIENEIWRIIDNSTNKPEDLPIEALQMAVLIIIVDAFMRCKILEEPKDQ
jgi:hypothetical protein